MSYYDWLKTRYVNALDASLKELQKDLAEHREECKAKSAETCPYEQKVEKAIEKKEDEIAREDVIPSGASSSERLTKSEMDDIANAFSGGKFTHGKGDFVRGWILPDGRNVELLPDIDGDWVDHDDVRAVLCKTRDVSSEPRDPLNDTDGRYTMLSLGGIRYHMLGDEGILDVWREPTKDQYEALADFAEYDHENMSGTKTVTVSFSKTDTVEYNSIGEMRKRLVGDVKRHFDGAEETPDSIAVRMFHG